MVLFTEKEIQTRVKSLALEVSYKNNPENSSRVMIGVLNGAFMFFADLVRNMEVDCEIDFMQAKSYLGQVVCCYRFGLSSKTTAEIFTRLSDQEKKTANEMAQTIIDCYEKYYYEVKDEAIS
jgi:hypoxanthine-guanine phosphoribosyltransferase